MRVTHRRYWVFFLLFLFSAIAYLDRVNMSVAGEAIAHEFGLSPIALGYLFSSFLWAYVLMMLPGGRLIDRWGPHVVASVATAVWSTAQMATGMVGSFIAMLMVRLGLGVGEAPFAPISYSSVRLWSPYTERGTAIAAISCGSSPGLALGAPAVAWLIETLSWRWSFIITGAVGFVWVASPDRCGWLPWPALAATSSVPARSCLDPSEPVSPADCRPGEFQRHQRRKSYRSCRVRQFVRCARSARPAACRRPERPDAGRVVTMAADRHSDTHLALVHGGPFCVSI